MVLRCFYDSNNETFLLFGFAGIEKTCKVLKLMKSRWIRYTIHVQRSIFRIFINFPDLLKCKYYKSAQQCLNCPEITPGCIQIKCSCLRHRKTKNSENRKSHIIYLSFTGCSVTARSCQKFTCISMFLNKYMK